MSAGIAPPKRVFGHGFLYNRGEKMSKSVGNVVDPFVLAKDYGVDQLRYFLLREVPFGQDGNYSREGIVSRINADLANDLGNLAQRSLSMIAKNCGGRVPKPGRLTEADKEILAAADAALSRVEEAIDAFAIHRALEILWALIADANRYFAGEEPWAHKKTNPERMETILYVTAEVSRQIAILVQPVMPESAGKLLDQLGVTEDARDFSSLGPKGRLKPGTRLPPPQPVFPRHVEAEETLAPGTAAL
jgi:methionyl-tRNA synthetase